MQRQPSRNVAAVMVAADVALFAGGLPLERCSLIAAADPSSSIALIAALLAANFALLGIAGLAIAATSLLARRAFSFIRKKAA